MKPHSVSQIGVTFYTFHDSWVRNRSPILGGQIVVRKLFVIALCVALLGVAGYFYFRKPVIERIDDPNRTAVWTCPGCPQGSSVSYTDRRDSTQTVYYYDGNADGLLHSMQVNDFHKTGVDEYGLNMGYYDRFVEITEDAYEADEWNAKSKANNWNDGRRWVARDSDEARQLQQQYEEVRAAYQNLHPKANLVENKPRIPPSPEPAEPIRAEKVRLFFDLLAEYRKEGAATQKARTRRASEIAQYRTFLAFGDMEEAYRALNKTEQASIFNTNSNLPKGIKLDGGSEVTEIAGISLTSEDPRDDFEWFLKLSYMEIDYMSAWRITDDDKKKAADAYRQGLRTKGLVVN